MTKDLLIKCPFCGEMMILEGVGTERHYICVNDCGEVWPGDQDFNVWRDEQAYKKSLTKPGSSSGGRKKYAKKPPKITPWYLR